MLNKNWYFNHWHSGWHSFFRRQLPNTLLDLSPKAKGKEQAPSKGVVCVPVTRLATLLPEKTRRATMPLAALLLATMLLCLALPGRPIDSLNLLHRQGSAPQLLQPILLPLGYTFSTVYEHSVERTPVEDLYYVSGQRLYPWRTRTRSHNAGLPAMAQQNGRFLTQGPWLVLEGGYTPLDSVYLRVGDAYLGRNELFIHASSMNQDERLELYALFPGERVQLVAARRPLLALITANKR